ncbi:glycosyltransferase [Candidatus Woesearchaeota archaeon]|nr:glycosyltransferase [Candidatus Woesearchaeota archaeon]
MGNDKNNRVRYRNLNELPFITVQIPTYNDPVAERCLKQCMNFNYPRNKYEIVVADDSTSIETQKLLKSYADKNPNFIKYVHRDNRENFKPGALKNALKESRGEIIVIFDSDWVPAEDFIKKIIKPFSDPKVAIVQARQGIYNKNTNLITRFAAYVMTIYHTIIMPISNKINCVFFCGTAGAVRRSALEEAGSWNVESITEDADLTVNLLLRGYKTVYMDFETPSEVPDNFEGFIKQQMRWCYGNARVFIDNASGILFSKDLNIKQRLMISYITLGNAVAPVVVIMTFFGLLGWFLGELTLFDMNDVITFFIRFLYTSGFLLMGILTLYKKQQLNELPYLILSALTIGIITAVAISIAFFRAVTNRKLRWFCTPKIANENFIKNIS